MSETARLIRFPSRGQHTEVEKVAVPVDAYHFGVNVRTEKLCLKQRFGTREIPWVSEDGTDIEEIQQLNFQSAIHFSPSTGSSALQFADKGSCVLLAAGGRKFCMRLVGSRWNSELRVTEITNVAQPSDLYEVYLTQAENYAVSGDDRRETWIYRNGQDARLSNGYTTVTSERENSEVPNAMRLPIYAHGRLVVVDGDRSLLVGDIIHGGDLTDSEDVIKFTEQTYWAEGQRFVVPTEAGRILSMYSLPVLGDNTRHGDLIIECEFQTWALDLAIHPRTAWSNTPMLRLVSLEGGAQGQHAYDTFNNDAIRRTQNGIETLSFSNQVGDNIRSPQQNISFPIIDFLKRDEGSYLRFTSLKVHRRERRVYCTTRPSGNKIHWGSRGWFSFNSETQNWDGLWTPPPWAEIVKIFLRYPMRGQERMLMFAGGGGKNIRVLEIDESFEYDYDESGEEFSIESQLEPRSLFADLNQKINLQEGVIQFSDVKGDFKFDVEWKSGTDNSCWNPWESKVFNCPERVPRLITHRLSEFEGSTKNGADIRSDIQYDLRIIWTGPACLRFVDLRLDRTDDHFDTEQESGITCSCSYCCDDYFRYSLSS